MYLKKLEVYGFKSFAERIEMTFGQGITGVVGPNGCGKSNIADAVRWVLGEQNARVLRGGRMEDVIFSGTEQRRSLAYCEVSLTFDNTAGNLPLEYAEVMVTRRVYRSGESEYFLNKTACRLKDITNLFRDTGIGKEGYSLIGQGRIDEILSIRSEDRRNVFEEAAGISKYKARKAEAEQRVAHTEQNLSRVEDILGELSAQLEPLAEQAETARLFLSLSEELKQLEINDFLYRYDRSQEQLARYADGRTALHQEAEQALQEEASIHESIDHAQDAISEMDGILSTAREQELALTRDTEAKEGALNVLRERNTQTERDRERNAQSVLEARQTLEELTRQETNAEPEQDARLQRMRDEIQRDELAAGLLVEDTAQKEKALEALKASVIAGMNRLSGVQSARARLTATHEGYLAREKVIADARETIGNQIEDAAESLRAAGSRYDTAQGVWDELQQRGAVLRSNAQTAEQEKDTAAQLLTRTQGALREASSRLKMLEQMERDYEGYNNSVREVMRAARGDAGILGVVAEILSVPKEYERAIDMTLGGQLQHIVCRAQEDAKRHIDRLRANRAGRATFLPLDAIRGRTLTQSERECLSMPGCVGVASELVEYDAMYRPVVENLLGRTVVATDLTSGIAIMRRAGHAFRLVTTEGDVMHSGGSMTGGSVQTRATNLLSREREIAEYRAAVARLTERENETLKRVQSFEEELDGLRAAIIELQEASHEQEIALEREQTHRDHAAATLTEREEARDNLLLEHSQIRSALEDIDEELQNTARLEQGEAVTAKDAQQDIAAQSAILSGVHASLNAMREELTAKRVQLAASERDREAMLRDHERRRQQCEALHEQLSLLQKQAQALEEQRGEGLAALETGGAEVCALRAKLEDRLSAYREMEIHRTAKQQALREQLDRREAAQKLHAGTLDRLHRMEVAESRLQSDMENLSGRIWDSYELTYAGAQAFADPLFDPALSSVRIEGIRKDIRAMGTVNTAAIEDHRLTGERYTSLLSQSKDLLRAKDDLLAIIADLSTRMEEQFTQQFALLNHNFAETFRVLFGGGRAELRLADDKHPLECGIDIVAQPPGKKLQLLSLLSGGERALTAIAILFAMLRIKPTPFCILDEIEAALDDSNITNFANYLVDYARSTQFIVITHRKGTMERCDSLYGITMAEKGISSMVSVELSALEQIETIG